MLIWNERGSVVSKPGYGDFTSCPGGDRLAQGGLKEWLQCCKRRSPLDCLPGHIWGSGATAPSRCAYHRPAGEARDGGGAGRNGERACQGRMTTNSLENILKLFLRWPGMLCYTSSQREICKVIEGQ